MDRHGAQLAEVELESPDEQVAIVAALKETESAPLLWLAATAGVVREQALLNTGLCRRFRTRPRPHLAASPCWSGALNATGTLRSPPTAEIGRMKPCCGEFADRYYVMRTRHIDVTVQEMPSLKMDGTSEAWLDCEWSRKRRKPMRAHHACGGPSGSVGKCAPLTRF